MSLCGLLVVYLAAENAFSSSISKAQYGAPPASQMGINPYLPSQPSNLPPSNFGSPPQGTPQQGYNPYRHTAISSRANPYITPPQLQQCQTPAHPSHPPPSAPPVQMYQVPPGSLPPVWRHALYLYIIHCNSNPSHFYLCFDDKLFSDFFFFCKLYVLK